MTTTEADVGEANARRLDAADPLARYRDRFLLPPGADGSPKAYLAGQSLGAQPATARAEVEAELDAWARLGVDGWWARERAWIDPSFLAAHAGQASRVRVERSDAKMSDFALSLVK